MHKSGKPRHIGDELINSDDEGKTICLNNLNLEEETEHHYTGTGNEGNNRKHKLDDYDIYN